MTFGEKLKDLRKELNMSIKDLSEKSGLSQVSISNYENNYRIPNPLSIRKLALALNCKYDELYGLR